MLPCGIAESVCDELTNYTPLSPHNGKSLVDKCFSGETTDEDFTATSCKDHVLLLISQIRNDAIHKDSISQELPSIFGELDRHGGT